MSLFVSKSAMDDFLDRQIVNCHGYYGNKKEVYKEALLAVKSFAKTENCIDAVPVVHGHWLYTGAEDFSWLQYKCSNCRHENGRDENYCPNCGAKMDEVV